MFACSWCNPEGETEAPAERGGNGVLSSSTSQRLKPSAGGGWASLAAETPIHGTGRGPRMGTEADRCVEGTGGDVLF